MSASAAAGGRAADQRAGRPLMARPSLRTRLAIRLVALSALALFGALQWGALQEPASRGRLVACVAIAVAAAGVADRAAGVRGRRRTVLLAAVNAAAVTAVLVAAGLPLRLLEPEAWPDVAAGLAQGVQALPTLSLPYRGLDPWVPVVLIVTGGLLLVLGAQLAVRAARRERRPLAAGLVLAAVCVIPIVEREPERPFVWGAVFTVLLGALLWGDRLERGHVAPAGLFVAVALGVALLAAPRLDAAEPWVDYQGIVASLSTPPATGFRWDHGYGPLDWPREDRVMLRVATAEPSYWKALDLETFDGFRWAAHDRLPRGTATEMAPDHADWTRRLRVSVRDLRSTQYITAGAGLAISDSPRLAMPAGPGTFSTGREPLRRGDTYAAEVYTPSPSVRELRIAGTQYPGFVAPYLTMDLPPEVGGPLTQVPGAPTSLGPVRIEFPRFSVLSLRTPPVAVGDGDAYYGGGAPLLRDSQYASTYELARRMREASTTPYEFVRRVQAHLASGYRYTEKPPRPARNRPPLVSFLFDSRAGYCQHFSGAMALLLRMGGVPARVSSGFSPGSFDEQRDEWVVRDVDAHSWVEAYFPRLGWVTFDPTPGVAPPHTQLLNGPAPLDAPTIPLRSDPRRADVPDRAPEAAAAPAEQDSGGFSGWTVVAVAPWVLALVGLGALVVRRRREERSELAELERALVVTGRSIEPTLTLHALEQRLARRAPAAAAYVAALRLTRYGGRSERPTAQQRAALRAELAAGLGWTGRLRAWWALPPLWLSPRPVYNQR